MTFKCDYCRVVAEHFLAWELHLVARRHQRNVQKLEITKEQAERSIYVAGFPSGTPDVNIFELFGKFGNILNIILNRGAKGSLYSVFIEFDNKETVTKVLKEKLMMDNTTLTVTKRHLRSNSFIDSEKILTKLEALQTLERQADSLVRELELSTSELASRRKICMMLQEAFRPVFPLVCVTPFGSSVNTLGFHGTDLDIFADLGVDEWSFTRSRHYPGHGMQGGPPPPTQEERVRIASEILSKVPGVFHIQPIGKARVPIVKFTHKPLGVTCDVSFRNPFSLRNTQLIHHYTMMDKRVRVLMMIIRYWAKLQNVMGKNCIDKLSNYALTILIVFALQQKSSLSLPAVDQLQKCHEARGRPKDVIEGWDCTVSWSVEHSHVTSRNKMSLYDLLKDFFRFYANFNFDTMVACPYLGRPVPKKAFQGDMKELIPMGMQRYVHNVVRNQFERLSYSSPMCVQDPFELVFNLARNVNMSGLETFRQRCSEAETLCKNVLESAFLPALFRRANQLGGEEEFLANEQEEPETETPRKEKEEEKEKNAASTEKKEDKTNDSQPKKDAAGKNEQKEKDTSKKPPGAYPHQESTSTNSTPSFKLPEKSNSNEPEPGSYASYKATMEKAQKAAAEKQPGSYRPQPGSYKPMDRPGMYRPMDKPGGYRPPMHGPFNLDKGMPYPPPDRYPPYHPMDKPRPHFMPPGGYLPPHLDKKFYPHNGKPGGFQDKPGGFYPPMDKPGSFHSSDKPGYRPPQEKPGSFQPSTDKPPPQFHSQDARSSTHKPTGRTSHYHQKNQDKSNQSNSSSGGAKDNDKSNTNQEKPTTYNKIMEPQRSHSFNKNNDKGNYYNKTGFKQDYSRPNAPKNYPSNGPKNLSNQGNSTKNYFNQNNSGGGSKNYANSPSGPKNFNQNSPSGGPKNFSNHGNSNDRSNAYNASGRTNNVTSNASSKNVSLDAPPRENDRPSSNSSSSTDKSSGHYSSGRPTPNYKPYADSKSNAFPDSKNNSYGESKSSTYGDAKSGPYDNKTGHYDAKTGSYEAKSGPYADAKTGSYGDNKSGSYGDNKSASYGDNKAASYGDNKAGSYGDSKPGSYGDSKPGSYGDSKPGSYGDSKPGSYGDSKPGSYGDSKSGSYGDSKPGSYGDSKPGSYGDSKPSSYGDSKPGSYGDSKPGSYGDSKPGSYGDSKPGSYGDSKPGSYVDSKPGFYRDSKSSSYGDSKPGSYGDSKPGSYGDSKPGSYGDSKPGSYGDSKPGSYGDSKPGSYGDSKPGSYGDSKPGSYGTTKTGSYGDAKTSYGDNKSSSYSDTKTGPYGDAKTSSYVETKTGSYGDSKSNSYVDNKPSSYGETKPGSYGENKPGSYGDNKPSSYADAKNTSYVEPSYQKNSYDKTQQSFKTNEKQQNPPPMPQRQEQPSYNKNPHYQTSDNKAYEKTAPSIYADKNHLYNSAPTPSESYSTGNKQMPFNPATTPKPEPYNTNMKKNYAQVVASGKSDGGRTSRSMPATEMESPNKTSVYYNSNIKNLSDVSMPDKPNPGQSPVLTNDLQKPIVPTQAPSTPYVVNPSVAYNRPAEAPSSRAMDMSRQQARTIPTQNHYVNNTGTSPISYATPQEILNSSLVSTAANTFSTHTHMGNASANIFNNTVSMGMAGSLGPYGNNRATSQAASNVSYGRGLPPTTNVQSPYSNPGPVTSMTSPNSYGRPMQMTSSNALDTYNRNSSEIFSQDKIVPMNLHTASVRSNPIEIQVTQNAGFGSEFGFHSYSPEVVGPDKQTMINNTGLTGPSLSMSTGTELWGDKSLPMTLSGMSGISGISGNQLVPGYSRPPGHPADATGAGFQREHPIVSSWPIHVPVVPTDEFMPYGMTPINRSSPMTHPSAHHAAPRGTVHIMPGSRLAPHFPGAVEQGFLPVFQ